MSYEYEDYENDDEPRRKMSLGTILLSLLLLGTVVVIGLIVLVYFKLTSIDTKPINTNPATMTAPVQPVEKMSPDGKRVIQSPMYANTANTANGASVPATSSAAVARSKDADDAVKNLRDNGDGVVSNTMPLENSRSLTNGATQAKKPRRRRENNGNNDTMPIPTTRNRNNHSYNTQDEIPLQPINRGERPLVPRERTLTPRRSNNSNSENHSAQRAAPQAERPLAPIRQKQSEEINELF